MLKVQPDVGQTSVPIIRVRVPQVRRASVFAPNLGGDQLRTHPLEQPPAPVRMMHT